MCCRACIVNSCCCGAELGNAVLFWGVMDALAHLLFLALPVQVSEVAPFASYFLGWIGLIIFADVVLVFACKAGIPAFLTGWMVVIAVNIGVCLVLWILIPVFFHIQSDPTIEWKPIEKSWSAIQNHSWWRVVTYASLAVLALAPFVHLYFWVVVKSLRRRMAMEIAVSFDPSQHDVTHTELTVWDWLYGGRGGNGRPMPTVHEEAGPQHQQTRF